MPTKKVQFCVTDTEDPHIARRHAIREKYPEVSNLHGRDPLFLPHLILNISLQVGCTAYAAEHVHSSFYFFLLAYAVGACLTHSLFLAIHELSHNAASPSMRVNQYIAMLANCPIGLPYSVTFKRYHMLHHSNFGSSLDTDIPTNLECYLVTDSATCYADHCLRKALYISCYTLVYALRPVIVRPDVIKVDDLFLANVAVQLLFDAVMYATCGPRALVFMLLSTFLAGSIHPLGGRFLSEHLEVTTGVETYSYYGPLNAWLWNIGYHEAHHDFPNITYNNLPTLVNMAPEFYHGSNKPGSSVTSSWMQTQFTFIFDDNMGPRKRVRRELKGES